MDSLDDLERAAGLDPDSPDSRLRRQLAEADDELIERLVQMRKDKGLTQKVVAERMKRDVAAVSNFERLRADPHLSTIRRYAAAIGASISHDVTDVDAEAPDGEGPEHANSRGWGRFALHWDALSRGASPDHDALMKLMESRLAQRRVFPDAPSADLMKAVLAAFVEAAETVDANQ